MSLKNAPNPAFALSSPSSRWSIAISLALWNAILGTIAIAGVTGYSYWVLIDSLDREDDELLQRRIADVENLLSQSHDDVLAMENLLRSIESTSVETPVISISLRLSLGDGKAVFSSTTSKSIPWPKTSELGSREDSDENGEWRFITKIAGRTGPNVAIIQAALDRKHESNMLGRYRKQLYTVIFIAMIVCAVGSYIIARRALEPLRALSKLAEGICATQIEQRLIPDGYSAELRQVAIIFNSMLDRLQLSIGRLSDFSGNIAHELRTPIHRLRGEVEVTLSAERSKDTYVDTLGSCLEEAGKLSGLVESLLFLARADQPKSLLSQETLDVRSELLTIVEFFEASADDSNVCVQIRCDDSVSIKADRSLFQRAIGNLVANSLSHTKAGDSIMIEVSLSPSFCTVSVKDTGAGISESDLPFVFDRLYRGRTQLRHFDAGHGLGLCIVKSIVEMHGGNVSIESVVDQGTTVCTQWRLTEWS